MKHKVELKVRKHFLILLFAVMVIAGAVFQGFYDWHLHQQNNSRLDGQPIIASLIDNAVNGLDTPAPVDAKTGQVYFPDSKLMLPAPPSDNISLKRIEYLSDANFDSSFGLQITTYGIISQSQSKLLNAQALAESKHENASDEMQAIFRQVPNLQACVRGVQLFYSPQNNGPTFELQFSKKLNSGKMLYAYTEKTCNAETLPDLVNYLKQLQSY